MASRVIKIFAGLLLAAIGFYIYQYYFGFAPDGIRIQRMTYNSSAELILNEYRAEQGLFFEKHRKFDPELHRGESYNKSKFVHLYYAGDNPEIAKYCDSCRFSDVAFKIAAYGKFSEDEGVWTIDNNGKVENLKSR